MNSENERTMHLKQEAVMYHSGPGEPSGKPFCLGQTDQA